MTISQIETTRAPDRQPLRHPVGGTTSLYLVRHGRTNANIRRILCGRTDLPLDAHGLDQARMAAERIGEMVDADALLTSPLQRARTTAEIIGMRNSLEPMVINDLMEMDFGQFEGMSFQAFLEDNEDLAARFVDLEDHDAGWPGGETRRVFHKRVLDTFTSILSDFREHSVVVVAHGGVFGSYLAQVHGTSPNDWRSFEIHNCSITHLEVTIEHTNVHVLNDIEHLAMLDEDSDLTDSE